MEAYLAHKCPKIALPLTQCSTPPQEHFCTWTTTQHEEKKKIIYSVAWEANSKGPASWRKCLGITLIIDQQVLATYMKLLKCGCAPQCTRFVKPDCSSTFPRLIHIRGVNITVYWLLPRYISGRNQDKPSFKLAVTSHQELQSIAIQSTNTLAI